MDFEAIAEHLNQHEFTKAVWLLPVAFALHVLEEAPRFKAWVNQHISVRYTWADFCRNNALGVVLTLGLCVAVVYDPQPAVVFAFFALAVWQCGFNTLFHVMSTAAYGAYSPGLITSLVLYPKLVLYLSKLAMRDELLNEDMALKALLLGGMIHVLVVVFQVYLVRPLQLFRFRRSALT
jgi:uncharacterized protein with HXXEE motif